MSVCYYKACYAHCIASLLSLKLLQLCVSVFIANSSEIDKEVLCCTKMYPDLLYAFTSIIRIHNY